ncbi:MAG: hypothetical protein JXA97_01810 [Anaerolineales bacterium]|nr:hypothetical protein [Anaerolineales bacterium]
MHRDDVKKIQNGLQGLVWLVRANVTTLLVFILIVLLFPVQLVLWIAGKDTFLNTEPYRVLRYVFVKGTAFKWELPHTGLSYEEWKRNPRR